ncbi:unnamed protein product, partial [Effrenium voratum]
ARDDEEPGTSYLEATPRKRSMRPPAPAGIGGISDTLYVEAKVPSEPPALALPADAAPAAAKVGVLDAAAVSAVEQVPANQNTRAEFDGYISQAFAYLDEAQKRMQARMGLPNVAAAAVPPRVASLQLATEVLVQLRQAENGKVWGTLLTLLSSCPGGERQELLLRCLRVAAPIGDTAGQLARCVVEDDVQRTQVPSLLVSANGLHTALVQALMRLSGSSFMEKELVMLVKEVEAMSSSGGNSMHLAVDSFIKSMVHALRSGQGEVHPSLTSVCHLVYSAAEVKFGILAAQNAVGTLLVSRVITPSILRQSTEGAERLAELSRLLQRIAHFAHHDEETSRGHAGVPDLHQVLKHVAALRELVSRVLSLPPDAQMGLPASTEDAEAAAAWIVETCRRWAGHVPAESGADPPGRARQQQQLQLACKGLARLGEPAHAAQAMPDPPRALDPRAGDW